jgi:protein-disulfide isomerase
MRKMNRFLQSCAGTLLLVGVVSPLALVAHDASVATIGKQAILMPELEARTSEKLNSQQAAYEAQVHQLELNQERARYSYRDHELNAMVDERVVDLEAKAKKTTTAALLEAIKPAPASESQVKAFYDAQNGAFGQSYESVASKIKDHLEQQANDSAKRHYLDLLRAKYDAVVLLEPLRETVVATGPERGPSNAPITIVEFSDFQCPYCGRFESVLKTVLAKYPAQIRLVYQNFPLSDVHPNAEKAAEAGVCAQQQGKFWELHDRMFQEQASLGPDALKDKASTLGLNAQTFNECLDSGRARDSVKSDVRAAGQLAVNSTPTSFVNGRLVVGAVTAENLTAIIEDELRRGALTARRQVARAPGPVTATGP